MNKEYIIELNGKRIGTTLLENADPPMGCVMGKIRFEGIESGYTLFKHFCDEHSVEVNDDDLSTKFLSTPFLPGIRVTSPEGLEISGAGTCVAGFDEDGWEIDIMGVPYPFYQEEFPHHTEAYFGS
jgi:hypothetical protein